MDLETAIALVVAAGSAVVSGAANAAGQSAWQSLLGLAQRVTGRAGRAPGAGSEPGPGLEEPSGTGELGAGAGAGTSDPGRQSGGSTGPADEAAVRALAAQLAERARSDGEFADELCRWALEYRSAIEQERGGGVHNVVRDNAKIEGNVVQGRDFHGDIHF